MYSILHITDLHRSKGDPISNAELLSALISDRESYEREDPPIRRPDAIVVSGDVIQGVTLNASDFEVELATQYEAAYDFLSQLTDRFLDGDRSRVVIVPGNHDIDWNVAFAAMEPVPEDAVPKNMPGALHEPGTPFRWDWKNRQLYCIQNRALYERRLEAFWQFFERFYADVGSMLRVASGSDANLYSFDEGRIGVAAFNSCAGNDCFSFRGEIPREVVAQAHLDLKDLGPWLLRIAVWHHDVEGPPHRSDYMDLEIVRGMIGRGFRLGLYGHQHRVQIAPQHAHLLTDETMAIASAGALCAGARELPMGALRGYSIVEIRDDYRGARIHVREMRFANLFARAALNDFMGRSYVDLEWTTPLDAAGRPEDPVAETRVAVLRRAEDALRGRGAPAEALELLAAADLTNDPFGRKLAIDAAVSLGDGQRMIDLLGEPGTIGEFVLLADAHINARNAPAAAEMMDKHFARLAVPPPIVEDLRTRIKAINWMNR